MRVVTLIQSQPALFTHSYISNIHTPAGLTDLVSVLSWATLNRQLLITDNRQALISQNANHTLSLIIDRVEICVEMG